MQQPENLDQSQRIENIANSIPGVLLQYKLYSDGKDQILYVSDQVTQLYDITEEGGYRDTNLLWGVVMEEDRQGVRDSLERSAQEMSLWEYSYRIKTDVDKTKWLLGRGHPREEQDGVLWDIVIFDITNYRETQEKLQLQSDKLKNALEATQVGVWDWDLRTGKFIVNDYWLKITEIEQVDGYTNFEDVLNAIALQDKPTVEKNIQQFLENVVNDKESFLNLEFRIKRPTDGRIKWVNARGKVTEYNSQGVPIALSGFLSDISSKRVSDLLLYESELKYRSLLEKTSDVVTFWDADYRILEVSPSGEKLFGSKSQELIGDHFLDNVPDADQLLLEEALELFRIGKDEADLTYRYNRKDGSVIWLRNKIVAFRNDKNEIYSLISTANDISEEVEMKRKLQETNWQLELAVETTKLGVWTANLVTQEFSTNPRNKVIFDIGEDNDIDYDKWLNRFEPEEQKKIWEVYEEVKQGFTVHEITFKIQDRKGDTRYILASVSPMTLENGKVSKIIGVNYDVTEYVRNEIQLKQTIEKKDTLFRELHHRIKNNLNLITNLLFLKSRATKDRVLLDFILETKNRIFSIAKTHDLLLTLEEVDQLFVKDYLEDLIPTIIKTYAIDDKRYPLDLQLTDAKLSVDIIFVIGLLVNELLSNTLKYAYDPVAGGPISILLTKQNGNYTLIYKDQGKGYDPESDNRVNSMGVNLIDMLLDQLEAEVKRETKNGVCYEISFSA